ncbi:hypothetical protein LCGC14_1141660, partial [marine sediment metagenome]
MEQRFRAISESQNRPQIPVKEQEKRSEMFATKVFNADRMLQF